MKKVLLCMIMVISMISSVVQARVLEDVNHVMCYYGNPNYPYFSFGNHAGTIIDVSSAVRDPGSNSWFDYIKVSSYSVDFATGKHEYYGVLVFRTDSYGRLYFGRDVYGSDWIEITPASFGRHMTQAYYCCFDKLAAEKAANWR